ncbi:MAG: hypothetical protein JNL79_12900 [Myxococcales bacterium]|nr:hypothetical protein [Myxococcales bacterium]
MAPPRTPGSGASPLATLLVVVGIVGIGWLAMRKMVQKQVDAHPAVSSTVGGGVPVVPQVPAAIADDAGKAGLIRFDVTLRMDGLDVSVDGAPACRDGHHRKIGRNSSNGAGSFDEAALTACLQPLLLTAGAKRPVALLVKAGPAVPSTYVDALIAALKRVGIADVIPPT